MLVITCLRVFYLEPHPSNPPWPQGWLLDFLKVSAQRSLSLTPAVLVFSIFFFFLAHPMMTASLISHQPLLLYSSRLSKSHESWAFFFSCPSCNTWRVVLNRCELNLFAFPAQHDKGERNPGWAFLLPPLSSVSSRTHARDSEESSPVPRKPGQEYDEIVTRNLVTQTTLASLEGFVQWGSKETHTHTYLYSYI